MKGSVMPSTLRLSHVAAVAALALVWSAAGCAQLDVVQPTTWFGGEKDEPQTPDKVVAVWTDAEAQHVDHRRTRGFGGRLMFYHREHNAPVAVDGALVVYAFDEEGRDPSDAKPNRKYAFTAEQFAGHHSKSKLGHSYSVWIPWDEVGGHQKNVSLICRFEPTDGPPIMGEQGRVTLRGPVPLAAKKDAKPATYLERVGPATTPILPVGHEATIPRGAAGDGAEEEGQEKMRTTTIPISPRFGRGMPVAQTNARATRALAAANERCEIRGSNVQMAGTATRPSVGPKGRASAETRSVGFRPDARPAQGEQSARQAFGRDPWQPSR